MLTASDPETAKRLLAEGQANVTARWKLYEHLAAMDYSATEPADRSVAAQT